MPALVKADRPEARGEQHFTEVNHLAPEPSAVHRAAALVGVNVARVGVLEMHEVGRAADFIEALKAK